MCAPLRMHLRLKFFIASMIELLSSNSIASSVSYIYGELIESA